MDRTVLEECIQKLGYYSPLPSSIFKNPSTAFIWQQFVNNVKPRSEVDVCRRNIIIKRMQEGSTLKEHTKFKIPEIQIYTELKNVHNDIELAKARIAEKEMRLCSIDEANRANYLTTNSLKHRIEEKEMKICMLKMKIKELETEKEQLDDMVQSKGVISISEENSASKETVLKLLKNLIEKIDKQSIKPKIQMNKKYTSELNITNFGSSRKPTCSTLKKNRTLRMHKFGSCTNLSSRRALFGNKDENVETIKDTDLLDQSTGLLPDSCFDFGADDEFLTTFQSSNFEATFSQKKKRNKYEQIGTNADIKPHVEQLLNTANKRIIWDTLCSLKENLLLDVTLKLENLELKTSVKQLGEEDEAEINYIFIKINLLSLKCRKRIRALKDVIRKKESEIMSNFHEESDGLSELELRFENIRKEAAVQIMNRGITNNSRELRQAFIKLNKIKDDLVLEIKNVKQYMKLHAEIIEQLGRTQKSTAMCVRKMNHFIADLGWTDTLIKNEYSSAIAAFIDFPLIQNRQCYFTKQNLYYRDIIENIIIDENERSEDLHLLITLLEHPQNPPERILSDIFRKKYKLQLLSSIEFPNVTFEGEKRELRKIMAVIETADRNTLHELQERENYIEPICEKLISQITSSKSRQVINSTTTINAVMELWLEMPFRRYVSTDRKVDGKTCTEFEQKFSYLKDKKEKKLKMQF